MSFTTSWFLGIVAFSTLIATASAASEPITLVADEWPPFSGSELPGNGISMDVTRAVLERAGYEVQPAILPWARIVSGAQDGDYDVVTSLFASAEMQQVLHYSEPFYTTEIKFIQRKGRDIAVGDLSSLRPYSIAVGAGFLYSPEFDDAEFLNKIEVTTTLQGIRMVAAGHADLTLDSTEVIRHSILRDDPTLADEIEVLEPALTSQNIHMAVSTFRPDHATIVDDFNRALAEMRADGSFDALLKKHNVN